MGQPVPLQLDFSAGMKRDPSRDRLPEGSVWNMVDMVPGLEAPVATRGGWRLEDFDLTVEEPPYAAEHVTGIAWAEFAAGPQLAVIDDAGELFTSAPSVNPELGEPGDMGSGWTELGAFEGDWAGVLSSDPAFRGAWDGEERHPYETPELVQETGNATEVGLAANQTAQINFFPPWDPVTVEGHTLLLAVLARGTNNVPAIETPSGWTLVGSRTGTSTRLSLFKREDAPSQAGSLAFNVRNPGPGSDTVLVVGQRFEYAGVGAEVGQSAVGSSGTSTAPATATLEGTLEGDELQVAAIGHRGAGGVTVTSPTNGFALAHDQSPLVMFAKEIVDGSGDRAASMAATLSSSVFWQTMIAAFHAKEQAEFVEYAVGDKVTHDGHAWVAVEANGGASAAEPGVDDAWEQVSVAYTTGDHVLYQSSLWRAKQATENDEPVVGDDWALVQGYAGVWSDTGEYEPGDVVTHEAKAWGAGTLANPSAPGTAVVTLSPVFFQELLILPAATGTDPPIKYDGTLTPATLGGSPPDGKFACVHRGRLALADGQTVWFSEAFDPETWDTDPGTGWFVKVSAPITGLASVFDHLLVFTDRRVERISGAIPPNAEGGDMELRSAFEVGCLDHRSIVVAGGNCIFASADGVFLTDGITLVDLTREAGISSFWRETIGTWDGDSIAAGLYQNHYIVTVSGTSPRTLVGRLDGNAWWRFTNIRTMMYARTTRAQEQLYFGLSDAPQVARLGPAFQAGDPSDGDGSAVLGLLETPFYYTDTLGMKSWRKLYVTYVAEDPGRLLAEYLHHPHMTVYETAGTLPSAEFSRASVETPLNSIGVAFRLTQQGGAAFMHVHGLEAEVEVQEGSRVSG